MASRVPRLALWIIVSSAAAGVPSHAAMNDWAEGTQAAADGATRDYYNRAGRLAWRHFMGDWRDAEDAEQGDVPYATARVADDDRAKWVEWDVTTLVRQWLAGRFPNQGFFLRAIGGGGAIVLASREYADAAQRPVLMVRGRSGEVRLPPAADTYLTPSTYRSLGDAPELRVSAQPEHVLVRFDMTPARPLGEVGRAVLRLRSLRQYGAAEIGVFRCRQGHEAPPCDPLFGLAARHPGDQGIERDEAVVFAAGFDRPDWEQRWSFVGVRGAVDVVSADPARKFSPFQGKALRVKIAKGANGALNTGFKFQRETGREPEEIYFRYYLRLGDDWRQTVEGGKMPGISGTYGVAGWGGRKSDGRNGWSARGAYLRSIPEGSNPLAGLHPIGTYCYHADMKGNYGDIWVWQDGYRGYLEKNRWYCVEQYLKLNTPGRRDGVLRAWIDGRPAFEKTDIRFRLTDRLKIEQIWMNVYHGGTKPSPYDQHAFIDNVVIARQYIGPVVRRR